MTRPEKHSIIFQISNEALSTTQDDVTRLLGEAMTSATYDALHPNEPAVMERQKKRADAQRRAQRDAARREQEMESRFQTVIAKCLDGTLLDVAMLHQPTKGWGWQACAGCDVEGYEAEQPEWPCRTFLLIEKGVS